MTTPDFVALDVETTGLFPPADRLVEVGAVRFDADGEILQTFDSLIRPGIPCSAGAFRVHGLTDELLASAPEPAVILPRFREFLGHRTEIILVGHNIQFDLSFLDIAFKELGLAPIDHEIACTLDLSRRRFPRFQSHRLPYLSDYLGFPNENGHRALADADRVRRLLMVIHNKELACKTA